MVNPWQCGKYMAMRKIHLHAKTQMNKTLSEGRKTQKGTVGILKWSLETAKLISGFRSHLLEVRMVVTLCQGLVTRRVCG